MCTRDTSSPSSFSCALATYAEVFEKCSFQTTHMKYHLYTKNINEGFTTQAIKQNSTFQAKTLRLIVDISFIVCVVSRNFDTSAISFPLLTLYRYGVAKK